MSTKGTSQRSACSKGWVERVRQGGLQRQRQCLIRGGRQWSVGGKGGKKLLCCVGAMRGRKSIEWENVTKVN